MKKGDAWQRDFQGAQADLILEHSLPTTPKGIHQVFSRIPRSQPLEPYGQTFGPFRSPAPSTRVKPHFWWKL
jgi:hypothetical protein